MSDLSLTSILKFFVEHLNPGSFQLQIRDPGWKNLDLDKHPQAATIKQDSLHRDRGLHGTHCREILLKRFLINSFWMVFYNIYLRSGVSSPGCWPG
jgi:hypothetical protein